MAGSQLNSKFLSLLHLIILKAAVNNTQRPILGRQRGLKHKLEIFGESFDKFSVQQISFHFDFGLLFF